MSVFNHRPDVTVNSDFIEVVHSVVPSALDLANLSISTHNNVVETVNAANKDARAQEFFVSYKKSFGNTLMSRALVSLYKASATTEDFVEDATVSWGNAFQSAAKNSSAYRFSSAESLVEARTQIEKNATNYEDQSEIIENVHEEFEGLGSGAVDVLVGAIAHPVQPKSDDEMVLQGVISALNFRSRSTGLIHADSIVEDTANGEHDGGLFLYGLSADELSNRTPVIRGIADFTLAALNAVDPDMEVADIRSLLVSGVDGLRGGALREIEYLRSKILDQFRHVKNELVGIGALPTSATDIDVLKQYLELACEARIYELSSRHVARSEQPTVSKRKNEIRKVVEGFETAGAFEEKKEINRKVGVLKGTSDCELDTNEKSVAAIKAKYVDNYRQEATLGDRIGDVLDYLRTVDLSKGDATAVKGLGYSLKVNGESAKAFQVRPDHIPGLSGGTQFKATRVIFTLQPDGTVGILEICDRQKAHEFGKKNKLGSKRRG